MLLFAVRFPALAICLCWMLYLAIDLNLRPTRYDRNVNLLVLVLVTTTIGTLTGSSVGWLDRIRPLKYDLYLYRADGVFGFQPSFLLGRLTRDCLAFRVIVSLTYRTLLTAITVVLAKRLISGLRSDFVIAVKAFLLDAYVATIFYLVVPIAGPGYAFASFPSGVHAPGLHPLLVHAPPNGMPSVHMSSALIIVFFCWERGVFRWLALGFAGLTAIATLATGEHYLVDLVAAFPYTLLILWISGAMHRQSSYSQPVAVGVDEESMVAS